MSKRIVGIFGAAALAVAATLTAPVSASAAPARAQVSCYGQAVSFSTTWGPEWAEWPTGWAQTGPNCADINVKPNYTIYVRTCFQRTGTCNGWTWIFGGTWGTAATDVLDGTNYYLQFSQGLGGLVAD
ncbi:hypothetical protein ACWCQK_34665 [Streptomyces sp. NPDC002306]